MFDFFRPERPFYLSPAHQAGLGTQVETVALKGQYIRLYAAMYN